jgi:hypothetical protein
MTPITICSFWIHRPKEFPKAANYLAMLRLLDKSCHRFGLQHTVLTDSVTAPQIYGAGLTPVLVELPANLMRASTEVHSRWLESPHSRGVHTIFVGADCLIRRDFRNDLPACDVAIGYMKGHKRWRLNNGFVYIPAESREKVAPLFRLVADDTGEKMCDDMLALERALVPMPPDYGVFTRRRLAVSFLPMPIWNRYMRSADDAAEEANVLHFMGGWDNGKALFFEWAARHMGD